MIFRTGQLHSLLSSTMKHVQEVTTYMARLILPYYMYMEGQKVHSYATENCKQYVLHHTCNVTFQIHFTFLITLY